MGELKAVRKNYKTGLSFDPTTMCLKMRRGTPCEYCYVAYHRDKGDMFSTQVVDLINYDGEVLRQRVATVADMNKVGGIRMFSSGDFLRTHRKHVIAFLNDCQTRGMQAKAITKNIHFVYEMHDHLALSCVNLSIDSLGPTAGSPVPYNLAVNVKKDYHKVRIRCVALSPDELTTYGDDKNVDVITLNHGKNGFYNFSDEEIAEAQRRYPGRVCCTTGKCDTCGLRCGATVER